MLTLTMRPYQGEVDLQLLVDLLNICRSADQIDHTISVSDLRTSINEPEVDPVRDLRVWENFDGQVIGYSSFWKSDSADANDAFLNFSVHPIARNQGVEEDMLAWAEARMAEEKRSQNQSILLRTGTRNTNIDRQTFLEKNGYQVDRQFFSMVRSLQKPIPTPCLPHGFTLRLLAGESEAPDWVEMFNQSFIDHWNYHPLTLERYLYLIRRPNYQPKMDWVAVAPNGQLAAFCYCSIDKEDNHKRNCQEGWVNVLGTRRGFRRQGLGRAMLLTGLKCLQNAGMKTVKLGVEAQNPNGALQLYESVGFTELYTDLSYVKAIS